MSLGRVAQARGRLEEAKGLFTEVLEIRQKKLGEEHLSTALAKKDLASVLLDQGEVAKAGVLINQALLTLGRSRPEDDGSVAEAEAVLGAYLAAQGRLADLYQKTGRADLAAELRR